ncbi:pseudouridine synthase [Thiohalorhabdus sp. Cl-TMA]|uniref:Pseudouridine synthase n=1 Tax=Thiohalorhabdus methylotrophus TaxID=3242694 RepID=A0ABV4TXA8_9GAMM
MAERVQKALARAGVASRREVDRWVVAGRVTINGQVAAPGDQVGPEDNVAIDGKTLSRRQADGETRLLAYHKPVGEVCTRSDPQGRPTVFDRLPDPGAGRWIQVGRLDVNTNGLLLLTTDGELANALMHPAREVEREYRVRVRGAPDAAVAERLQSGVELEDGPARFTRVELLPTRGKNAELRVVLTEGRKREVRRLLEAVGHPVSRLLRTRYGPVSLPRDLKPGQWRELDEGEVTRLRRAAGQDDR